MNNPIFKSACDQVLNEKLGSNGIGTYGEKTVHSVLKHYLEPNNANHEVKVGNYIADICNEEGIIEIQTRNFNKLRNKLTSFLTASPVTIVYPIPKAKWIRWINPQSGEISPPRKSPKAGKPYSIFPELYKIKNHLTNPNLHIHIILMYMEEYRLLDGWSIDKKKGSTKCDHIPTELIEEILIDTLADYQCLIPSSLEEPFTSSDYKKATGIPISHAQTGLNILHHVGAVNRIGKKGNTYLYSRADSYSYAYMNTRI